MATNVPLENVEDETLAYFNRLAAQVENSFSQLITQLIARKETLLRKVFLLREDFNNKEHARREAIQELEKTQEYLAQLSLKANLNLPVHEEARETYEQGKQQLQIPTKLPPLFLSFPTRDMFLQMIENLGELSEIPNYSHKKDPVLTFGKRGISAGEFEQARGLALDNTKQVIYIADRNNNRIQLFSFQTEFISKFGENELKKPHGLAVTEHHIFITDVTLHSLLRYNKHTLQFLDKTGGEGKEEGKLYYPRGLAVDWNGDVFIADSDNNRVSIFSKLLNFSSCFGQGQLYFPEDIKLTTESVVVLDWSPNCVHFFDRNGELLSSCVTQGSGQKCLVEFPCFFCLDVANNIIVSDSDHNEIKIITSSGELVHAMRSGELQRPSGIAISDAGNIYVVSQNPECILLCF